MCGIVGAIGARDIVPVLVEGLKRLEYRGYDSCGVAVLQDGHLRRSRSTQRVAELQTQADAEGVAAPLGIAHTRWATHGAPAVHNAHPHFSHGPGLNAAEAGQADTGRVALVHNGIIENHEELRRELQAKGYVFHSQTDTEVIAHLVDHLYQGNLLEAVKAAVRRLLNVVVQAARRAGDDFAFEPNGEHLWARVRNRLNDLMRALLSAGALSSDGSPFDVR